MPGLETGRPLPRPRRRVPHSPHPADGAPISTTLTPRSCPLSKSRQPTAGSSGSGRKRWSAATSPALRPAATTTPAVPAPATQPTAACSASTGACWARMRRNSNAARSGTLFRGRHTFASTGARMIVHLTADGHLMGDILESAKPPTLQVQVAGTAARWRRWRCCAARKWSTRTPLWSR